MVGDDTVEFLWFLVVMRRIDRIGLLSLLFDDILSLKLLKR